MTGRHCGVCVPSCSPLHSQSGGCDPYFVVKVTNGVLKDFTVFDYRLHVPKKKVWGLQYGLGAVGKVVVAFCTLKKGHPL